MIMHTECICIMVLNLYIVNILVTLLCRILKIISYTLLCCRQTDKNYAIMWCHKAVAYYPVLRAIPFINVQNRMTLPKCQCTAEQYHNAVFDV